MNKTIQKKLYAIFAEFKDFSGENTFLHMYQYCTPFECVKTKRLIEDKIIDELTYDIDSIKVWDEDMLKDVNLKDLNIFISDPNDEEVISPDVPMEIVDENNNNIEE